MTYDEFKDAILDRASEYYPQDYSVQIRDVEKMNGLVLQGLLITREGVNVSPTIYLNQFYEKFKEGKSLDDIFEEIARLYEDSGKDSPMDFGFFFDYDEVKGRLCLKLINHDMNRSLLSGIPHIPYLDLEIVFFYLLEGYEADTASILIRNEHAANWGVCAQDLLKHALVNTPKLFSPRFFTMSNLLKDMGMWDGEPNGDIPMHILTNERKTFGASSLLYPDLLAKIGDEFGDDYYLIPSSIHEVILIQKRDLGDVSELNNMIREVNLTQLSHDEILSNHYYTYVRKEEALIA